MYYIIKLIADVITKHIHTLKV